MKKIILLLVSVVFMSCSTNENSVNFLITPSWIQGTWTKDVTGEVLVITKSDIKYNGYSFGAEARKKFPFDNFNTVQTIRKTSTEYIFDYTQIKGGAPLRFIFKKINDNKLEATGHLSGTYTKK